MKPRRTIAVPLSNTGETILIPDKPTVSFGVQHCTNLRRYSFQIMGGAFLAVAIFLCAGLTAFAQTFPLDPNQNQGVSFDQINLLWSGATTINSDTAQMNVDFSQLASAFPSLPSGYLNVATAQGWAVQNLPVLSGFSPAYPGLSTNLGLDDPSGTNASYLNAYIEYSASPVTGFTGGSLLPFSVADTDYNAEGDGAPVSGGTPSPPAAGTITFQAGGLFKLGIQLGHENVQTAHNQCAPAAVANSLEWLKNSAPVAIPDKNVIGLRGSNVAPNSANSRVGKLDLTMMRGARSRVDGDATPRRKNVEGKLQYLADSNVGHLIYQKHQSTVFGDENVPAGGLMSIGQGKTINPDWILSELQRGEDVEMCYSYLGGGGHCVELVAGGKILGVPWVAHMSDHLQTNNDANDTRGTGNVDFGYFRRLANGALKLEGLFGGDTAIVGLVTSQSVPEPATALLLVGALVMLARKRAARAPAAAG